MIQKHMAESSENLESIYSSLAKAATDLETRAPAGRFGCPDGCGLCCVGFDPQVTRPELEYLATWLADRPEFDELVFRPRKEAETTCRFYRPASKFHCAVYPARPLVCRTFAYTSSNDKSGKQVFAFCRHMPTNGPRKLVGPEIVEELGTAVPASRDAGVAIASMDPEAGTVNLAEAIGKAVSKVRWLRSLDPDKPEPDNPVPPLVPPQAA